MRFLLQVLSVARVEAVFFARHARLLIAMGAIVLVPSFYVLIYLTSVWDPASRTRALDVAIVNLDRDIVYGEQQFNLGRELVDELRREAYFGYVDYRDEARARADVRSGRLDFALIIPADFSANAVPGHAPDAAKPVVFSVEGNSFETAAIARHFAEALELRLNEQLNERRWGLALSQALGSQRSVERLRAGVDELLNGAQRLAAGSAQLSRGAAALAQGSLPLREGGESLVRGVRQMGDGVRQLERNSQQAAELPRLARGAETLAAGHEELGKGMSQMRDASGKMLQMVSNFQESLAESAFVPDTAVEGLARLREGLGALNAGLQSAEIAQQRLAAGASRLNVGVAGASAGVQTLIGGIQSAGERLPAEPLLEEFSAGSEALLEGSRKLAEASRELDEGARRLAFGLEQLREALPTGERAPAGSARGLAHSVQPVVEKEAPVRNSGSGFAPNVIAGALWLGAAVAAFLLHVRVLPSEMRRYAAPVRLLGKMAVPACAVLLQVLCVMLAARYGLGVDVVHGAAFTLILLGAALTFLLVIFALCLSLGDAGKGLVMILLAIQLSSSGGIMPVELSGGLFAELSPWLPLTWVVTALKAAMFGAFSSAWQAPLAQLGICALLAFVCACVFGRWRYVNTAQERPTPEF